MQLKKNELYWSTHFDVWVALAVDIKKSIGTPEKIGTKERHLGQLDKVEFVMRGSEYFVQGMHFSQ